MADGIYRRSGHPAGFITGQAIHDLSGRPIGQLRDTHVYSLSGHYIGELYDGMVVNKNMSLGTIGPSGVAHAGAHEFGSRGPSGCPFPDVFDKLVAPHA